MDKNKVLKKLEGVVPKHCDRCGHKYHPHDMEVIKTDNNVTAIHVKCHNCKNNYILNMFSPMNGLMGTSKAQVNLDLSNSKEVVKFAGLESIDTDEALDAFNQINKTELLESFFRKNQFDATDTNNTNPEDSGKSE
jgi:hypothetical protein